ncbi:MAG: hypothetical protein AMS27_05925 [Bacteroides sp. SM23_62_1]|nr:MAG: hypothetical protein AMS27_05925 [Bacteroides sp. SM23_62_1]
MGYVFGCIVVSGYCLLVPGGYGLCIWVYSGSLLMGDMLFGCLLSVVGFPLVWNRQGSEKCSCLFSVNVGAGVWKKKFSKVVFLMLKKEYLKVSAGAVL